MSYPEPTVANLIEYLQGLIEIDPEIASYSVTFEREGLWHGTSFQYKDGIFPI